MTEQRKTGPQHIGSWLSKNLLAGIVAFIALVTYLVMALFLFFWRTGLSDLAWTRSIFLLSGIEAVTFTAVGWLFGKEIHREQAAKAEEQVTEARAETEQTQAKLSVAQQRAGDAERVAAVEHTKGATVARAAALATRRPAAGTRRSPQSDTAIAEDGDGMTGVSADNLRLLAELVQELYPQTSGAAVTSGGSPGTDRS